MARRDGSGPMGMGAINGKGLGLCSGDYPQMSRFGRGSGCVRGNRQRYRNDCGRRLGRRYMHYQANLNNVDYKDEDMGESKLM